MKKRKEMKWNKTHKFSYSKFAPKKKYKHKFT